MWEILKMKIKFFGLKKKWRNEKENKMNIWEK